MVLYKLTANELLVMQYVWVENQKNNSISPMDVIKKFSIDKGWSRSTTSMILKRLKSKEFIDTSKFGFNNVIKVLILYNDYCNKVVSLDSAILKHCESYEAIINCFNTISVTDDLAKELKEILNE